MSEGSVNGAEDLNQPIWYASYGSNLSRERFLRYLVGGPIPNSPSQQVQEAARDPRPPSGDQPYAIDRRMFFAGSSKRWGDGGVAFLDADQPCDQPVKGRVWRITLGQLEDVFRQENGQADVTSVDLTQLLAAESLTLLQRWYGRLEVLGQLDGLPVITLATPRRMLAGTGLTTFEPKPAHLSYLSVIAQGLDESWSMTASQAAEYLASLPGNKTSYRSKELAADLLAATA